ncbi:MAG: hypothetical protein L6R41_003872 [Letrouitia leprolyta]|nr:MAG: hypothetical protein L6R41_003872 [Letrouitia leprolyta]
MYSWLSPSKSRKPHAQSQSSPYFRPRISSIQTSIDDDHLTPPDLPKHPTLTHQPTSTVPTTRDLPPLITHDLKPAQSSQRPSNKIADWFSGESQPITFSIIPSPTQEQPDSTKVMPPDSSTEKSRKPPLTSRFSLFSTKSSPPKPPLTTHDEWHDLDIKSTLNPPNADPFSPSSFKNLQQNAEGLLLKLQAAYKERCEALHDVLAEKEAQTEELEGAETRTRHLKIQLDDMTVKLQEQDKAMMDLVDQLAQEKEARRIESQPENIWKSRTSTASEMSMDSEADSLFSPAMSISSVSTFNSPEILQTPTRKRPERVEVSPTNSEAWNLVRILQLENTSLKNRLGCLENTVDDCLDMVNGLF